MRPDCDIAVTDFHPTTSDGWTLELKRYRVREALRGGDGSLPVVLCHGLSCSARLWDLSEDVSFARYLARRGHDVWVPSLRGAGMGSKPILYTLREIFQFKLPRLRPPRRAMGARNWNFDDHALSDVPTIIDTVKAETGAKKVLWVGHSMGGLAMYAYLQRSGRDDVAGFATLSSPIRAPRPLNRGYRLAVRFAPFIRLGRAALNNQFIALFGILTGLAPMGYMWWRRRNVRGLAVRSFYRNVIHDVSQGVVEQLSTTILTGSLLSADGSYDYTAGLSRVTAPILCVVGAADNICEPAGVRFVCEHVGSSDKTCVEAGTANGFSADYGHLDLILGRNASKDVFPLIADWLSRHGRG